MTIAYGYLGVGLCGRCSYPRHLFVSSDEPDNSARCQDCHNRYSYQDVVLHVPIMDETPNCEVCGNPELSDLELDERDNKWQFVTAYLADRERTIIVHRDCSTLSRNSHDCLDCDLVYATFRNLDWRRQIRTVGFMELTQIEGEHRCNECTNTFYQENGGRHNYSSCPCCDDNFHRDNGSWFRDTLYCQNCFDNYYYDCGDCGDGCWEGDGHECSDDEDEDTSVIHSYTYHPTPYFFGKGQYYLGFELEVEARDNSRYEGAELAQSALGAHAYMKDDGSLNDGFEVVTHPHTLEAYQRDFNWEFIPQLKRQGYRSWNTETCGLHVHVSRTAFGTGESPWGRADREALILKRQAHELRFMKLIYDNQRQVERIAGRSGNHYATFGDKGKLVEKVKFGNQSNGRYSAINTENDMTLEVRVFKGSLRKERVLSALEFVTASVEYTRDLKVTSKNQALSWLRFTAYVSSNIETYPNLALIMSESFASDNNPNEN
jgi:hypothetical protein